MKKEKKKMKKTKVIVLLILLVIIVLGAIKAYKMATTSSKNNTIKAVKIEEMNGKKIKTDFKITFKDYKVASAIKTTNFLTEEQAKAEFNNYDFVKQHEMQDVELELKGKKLTVSMSEEFLKKELGYSEDDKNVLNPEDIPYKPINQDMIIKLLIEQGYTIKSAN